MDDVDIDEALVRTLLHEQHPDLAGLELREVAGGWDNQMWRLGEELAVRMPRTLRAPSLLRTEQQWLPFLAPSLPLPVPSPVRVGEPSARFPKTWTVARWVDGEPADHTPISSPRAAGTLAGFLRALHRTAPGEAPANPVRGVPLQTLAHDFDECFPPWSPPVTSPLTCDVPGSRPSRLPHGTTRRYGFTVISIPRMSSSPKGRCPA
jgi:aminoglycoside phosphotransferase (APT) family kinase protein